MLWYFTQIAKRLSDTTVCKTIVREWSCSQSQWQVGTANGELGFVTSDYTTILRHWSHPVSDCCVDQRLWQSVLFNPFWDAFLVRRAQEEKLILAIGSPKLFLRTKACKFPNTFLHADQHAQERVCPQTFNLAFVVMWRILNIWNHRRRNRDSFWENVWGPLTADKNFTSTGTRIAMAVSFTSSEYETYEAMSWSESLHALMHWRNSSVEIGRGCNLLTYLVPGDTELIIQFSVYKILKSSVKFL